MRHAALVVLCVLSLPLAGADEPTPVPAPVRLTLGEFATLVPSTTTRQSSALIDVPPGLRTLHVFASAGAAVSIGVEEGAVGAAGALLDPVRREAGAGRVHLSRTSPTPGLHRVVVTTGAGVPDAVAVRVEVEEAGAPALFDLAFDRPPAGLRQFRLFVPPHEGLAELRRGSSPDSIRVRVTSPTGALGEPASLPLVLDGAQAGGVYGVEIVDGPDDAAAQLELRVPTPGSISVDAARPTRLEFGRETTFTLGGKAAQRAHFVLTIGPGSYGCDVRVSATGEGDAHPDADVFVSRAGAVEAGLDDAEYVGMRTGPEESVHLGGTAGPAPGDYHVDVELVDPDVGADLTITAIRRLEPPPSIDAAPARPLGTFAPCVVPAAADRVAWSTVTLPASATTLYAQVIDASSDVDLLVADPASGAIVARSLEFQVDESLRWELPGRPAQETTPRTYRLGVVARGHPGGDVTYRLAVAADAPAPLPADLRLPPFARAAPLNEVEAVAQAVAEIEVKDATGSAVCIDSRGYLLTCRHVIVDDATEQPTTGPILVAFPDAFDRPPRQAFRARVVETDAELDLALLRIESDVYGRAVADDLGLPVLALADAPPRLGDPVLVAGYPGDGSEQDRPPVIVSRGVVAGLESVGDRLVWIKTDSWIATGHSGGAVVDRGGRCLGIAAATLGVHDAMGLVRPIGLVPPGWIPPRPAAPRRK